MKSPLYSLFALLTSCTYTLPPEPGPDAGIDGAVYVCEGTERVLTCGADTYEVCVPTTGCSRRYWCDGHWYWYCSPDGGT